jgi:hypothetical protein
MCDLQPSFFMEAGLQVMFATMTSNSSMVAAAMAKAEENQVSLVLAAQQQADVELTAASEYDYLVFWYRFDNSSNPSQDSMGNRAISLSSSANLVASDSRIGQGSMRLSTSNDYLLLNSSEWASGSSFSVAFWQKKTVPVQDSFFFEFMSAHRGVVDYVNYNNAMYFGKGSEKDSIHVRFGKTFQSFFTGYDQTEVGTWTHYAMIVNKINV